MVVVPIAEDNSELFVVCMRLLLGVDDNGCAKTIDVVTLITGRVPMSIETAINAVGTHRGM